MTIIRAAIVDDNDELRNAMNQYLQTQKDISIVGEAANGQDALKMIQEKQPDVVLLDMIMPSLDGFGVLAQLQRTPLEKRPRVIAVTALGRDDFIRRAVELGGAVRDVIALPAGVARRHGISLHAGEALFVGLPRFQGDLH